MINTGLFLLMNRKSYKMASDSDDDRFISFILFFGITIIYLCLLTLLLIVLTRGVKKNYKMTVTNVLIENPNRNNYVGDGDVYFTDGKISVVLSLHQADKYKVGNKYVVELYTNDIHPVICFLIFISLLFIMGVIGPYVLYMLLLKDEEM